jgi:hypothetical protein
VPGKCAVLTPLRCPLPQIASEGLKGRVFEVSLADLQKVRRAAACSSSSRLSGRPAQYCSQQKQAARTSSTSQKPVGLK